MKNVFLLVLVLFAVACNVEREEIKSPTLTLEERRAKMKSDREAEYKAYLETEEGQKKIAETLLQGKSGRGGGEATHCDCMYSISSVEVDLDDAVAYEYELWSTEGCGNAVGSCNYFTAHYSDYHPECFPDPLNPACIDILDGTYPVYSEPFNCQVPIGGLFDVNYGAIGRANFVDCTEKFIGASSITFTIKCCDRSPTAGNDLNNCGDPSQCYSTAPITINTDGGWDTDGSVDITLGGECGCEPSI